MSWRFEGTYFESCSCDAVCPCTWSGLTAKATLDRCRALLAYHIADGEIDGVDVSGLTFALFLDTPPIMSEGDWRVGVFLDAAASDEQAGNMTRSPLPSAKRTTLPAVAVPSTRPTREASICRMNSEKRRNSRRLHSIGIVIAIKIFAPRRREVAAPATDIR